MKLSFEAIAKRWCDRRNARQTAAALIGFGAEATELLAHDVGASASQLRVLAGRWPESPPLLSRRLAALGLDEAAIGHTQPAVLRDLQRVCSLCVSTRDCKHDLASRDPSDPAWQVYCPNVTTLEALTTELATNRSEECCNPKQ
jgi:hypothetical protein